MYPADPTLLLILLVVTVILVLGSRNLRRLWQNRWLTQLDALILLVSGMLGAVFLAGAGGQERQQPHSAS
jgi:multisubunit Na+/H+ antiporter MnhB subunit